MRESGKRDEYGLTRKQRTFADAYLLTGNKRASAIKAGVSPKSAGTIAARMCTNVNIMNYLAQRRGVIAKKLEDDYCISMDILLRELAAIAFFDIGKMYDDNGVLLPIHKMDKMTRRAIASFDTKEIVDSDGALIVRVTKIRTASKLAAIELLGRHLGMWGQNDGGERSILNIQIITDKNQLDHPDY
jgi:phage terminase small subunit